MKIETKFNIGDEVIVKGSNERFIIYEIHVHNNMLVDYHATPINENDRAVSLDEDELELVPKQILTAREKAYLEAVIKPFKDEVEKVYKERYSKFTDRIVIDLRTQTMFMPAFEKGRCYNGMEMNKLYTLSELGLFEGDEE